MSRFLLIDTDGETILATIGAATEALALEYADTGQTIVALNEGADGGAFIDDSTVKWSAGDATLVLIADDTPVSDFADYEMEVVTP